MKKKTFNILITLLIWSLYILFAYIGATAYTSKPEPKPIDTSQAETLKVWKQSVNAEYDRNNITFKGGETK